VIESLGWRAAAGRCAVQRTLVVRAPIDAALEFLGHAGEVPAHRGPGGGRVARDERREDGLVVGERLLSQRRGVEVLFELGPEVPVTLVPQILDGQRQRGIAGGRGDRNVKGAIGRVPSLRIVGEFAHPRDQRPQLGDARGADRAGGLGADLALDETARLQQVERRRAAVARRPVGLAGSLGAE
jgi:hypothetical protein